MTNQIGVSGPPVVPARRVGAVDVSPVEHAAPTRAVERTGNAVEGDLSRAGIDVRTLLEGGADALIARATPSATGLAELLERARAALVRGTPGEVLATLDDGWEGAARTEGGWYYRAAALTLLGLPGEAERVLQQALVLRGGSVALHFLRSVLRSSQGDSGGAREALAAALARRPGDTVLVAWRAVLTARQGDRAGALAMLAPLSVSDHSTAVLSWARQAISAASTDSARASLAAQRDAELVFETADVPDSADSERGKARGPASAITSAVPEEGELDSPGTFAPLDRALRRVGMRFASASPAEVRSELTALLQSLASGGVLGGAASPVQIAAARSVIEAALSVLSQSESSVAPAHPATQSAAPPATQSAMQSATQSATQFATQSATQPTRSGVGMRHATPSQQLEAAPDPAGRWRLTPRHSLGTVPAETPMRDPQSPLVSLLTALRAGSIANALTWMPRVAGAEGEATASVIRLMMHGAGRTGEPRAVGAPVGDANAAVNAGASGTSGASGASSTSAASVTVGAPRASSRHNDPLHVPVRLGLSLLSEASAREEAQSALRGASAVGTPSAEMRTLSWTGGTPAEMAGRAASQASTAPEPFAGSDPSRPEAAGLPHAGQSESRAAALNSTALPAMLAPPRALTGGFNSIGASHDAPRAGFLSSSGRLRAVALVCMVLAFVALVLGYGIAAVALAGGASWLALRSSAVNAVARRLEAAAQASEEVQAPHATPAAALQTVTSEVDSR